MAFRVLVMSPLHQTGSSVASALVAQALTYANRSVTLAYTDAASLLPKYLGIKHQNDPTRSIMQVARLIQSQALDDNDILDYTVEYAKNVHLMSFNDAALNERDSANIIKHVYTHVPTDICVVDGSDDIDTTITKNLISLSDLVFIVVTPSRKDFARLQYWLDGVALSKHPNVCVIINHYDDAIDSLRNMAKTIGMSANRVCKIHSNPFIRKLCLTGKFAEIVPYVKGLDPRVASLSCDLKELTQCVISTSAVMGKYSQEDFL